MSDIDDSTDWRISREFVAVDLTQSFVLSWVIESGALLVDVDLYLTPAHPFYERPRPAEKICIRAAVIEFPFCVGLQADGGIENADMVDVAARLGHGAIDGLRQLAKGHFEISGEFGVVIVDAERPILRLKGP